MTIAFDPRRYRLALSAARRGLDLSAFDEAKHPRDAAGHFRSLVGGMGQGAQHELPDGVAVMRYWDDYLPQGKRFGVVVPKKGVNLHDTAEQAAKDALDASAQRATAKSIGGKRRFKGIDDAIERFDAPPAAKAERHIPLDSTWDKPHIRPAKIPSHGAPVDGGSAVYVGGELVGYVKKGRVTTNVVKTSWGGEAGRSERDGWLAYGPRGAVDRPLTGSGFVRGDAIAALRRHHGG